MLAVILQRYSPMILQGVMAALRGPPWTLRPLRLVIYLTLSCRMQAFLFRTEVRHIFAKFEVLTIVERCNRVISISKYLLAVPYTSRNQLAAS